LLIAPAHAAASSWARRSETDPSAGLTADCAAEEFRGSLERMLKVDQVHVIRHKVLVEGRSQRQVAKDFGISRVTVRKYVEEAVPVRKETAPRVRPVCGPRRRGRSRADADKDRTISGMRASRVMHTPT